LLTHYRAEREAADLSKGDVRDNLIDMLHRAQNLVRQSVAYLSDPRAISISYNNLALVYYEEALLWQACPGSINPMQVWQQAERAISMAKHEQPVHPAVYISEAEVLCAKLKLKDQTNATPDPDGNKQANRILDLIKIAVENGYQVSDEQELLKRSPVLNVLSAIYPDYQSKLYKAIWND
jgi:hypothetical protein